MLRRRLRTLLLLTLSAAPATLAPADASACAAGAVSATGAIGADAQRIFIAAASDQTEVVVQATVPTSREAYGILIPLPVRPTLDATPVDAAELDALERATRVVVVDDTPAPSGGGCGAAASDNKAGVGGTNGVQVVESVAIGPLQAVVLTSSSSTSLTAWLTSNGFALPPGAAPIVERYVKPGAYFIAAKRADTATSEDPSSLGVHFSLPGEQVTIPLPIARLGESAEVAFALFVAAASPMGPTTPYAPLALTDLDKATVRANGYRAGLARAVTAKGGRAFLSEGVFPAASAGLTGRLATFVGAGASITRLTTVTTPASLTDDLTVSNVVVPAPGGRLDVTRDAGGCTDVAGAASPLTYGALVLLFGLRLRRRPA